MLGLASINASATSIEQDISVPEPLEQVHVEFNGPEGRSIVTDALPEIEANITAMPASQAIKCTSLSRTSQVLKAADGTILKTIDVVKMDIYLRGRRTFDYVYILEGLTRSLLSRPVLKYLGLISQDFPNVTLNLEKAPLIVTEHGQALNKLIIEFPELFDNQCSIKLCQSFLHHCKFSDEISQLLIPLKSLQKKGVIFLWLPEHQTAFELAREYLASGTVLTYYSPTRQTCLLVDALRLKELGFVLKQLQDDGTWRPVQAGSRFLISAETR